MPSPYQDDSYLQHLREKSDLARERRHRESLLYTYGEVDPKKLDQMERAFQMDMIDHHYKEGGLGGLMELPPSVRKEYEPEGKYHGLLTEYLYKKFLEERE